MAAVVSIWVAASPALGAESGGDGGGTEAAARESTESSGAESARRTGVGLDVGIPRSSAAGGMVGLGSGLTTPALSPGIRVPIGLTEQWRIEPNVGFSYWQADTHNVRVGSDGFGSSTESRTLERRGWNVDAGLAAHRTWSGPGETRLYLGLLAGVAYGKTTSDVGSGGETSLGGGLVGT